MRRILFTIALTMGCVGSTGSDLVTFSTYASGPRDHAAGTPLELESGRGYHVSLTRARVHVGAVYLNRSLPISGAQATSCILPGIYVAQNLGGLDIDVLSPSPQRFPELGNGTADRALAAEVWLSGGDVNDEDDATTILDIAGTASKGAETYPFEGKITLGKNWRIPPSDVTTPGANPICKVRIVSPIPVSITPRNGGSLALEIDPTGWFANVDFAALPKTDDVYRFADAPTDPASKNLYLGLRASIGVYRFSWTEAR